VKARTSLAAVAAAAAALAAAPAGALAAGPRNAPAAPTVQLPGDAAAASVRADPHTWIVGVRAGGGAIARAHGGRRIAGRAWLVRRARANALAAALGERGLLDYAEPNRLARRAQAPAPDPLSPFARWRDFVVGDAVPPPVTPESPLIALVDTQLDVEHPELKGSNITTAGVRPATDEHGTATSTVAAAPANGVGILGIWPGARALDVPLPNGQAILCSDSVGGIDRAIAAGADVINMSYGSTVACIAEREQLLRAIKAGAVPVAAVGNDYLRGNPPEYPASFTHVITVAGIGSDSRPTSFSSTSASVDLSAPGVGILTAVPIGTDTQDGNQDGFAYLDGTSFAAPMVAAAIAWVRAARPTLSPSQAAQAVRQGATDIFERGFDAATGYGALSLPGALSRKPPADDPMEPNDDFRYVNGRAFGRPVRPLFSGRPAAIAATVDYAEDPIDLYRIRVPGRKRVRLSLRSRLGDADLFVYAPRGRALETSRALTGSSRRGQATDRASVRNRGRRRRTLYVAVGFSEANPLRVVDANYVLRAR